MTIYCYNSQSCNYINCGGAGTCSDLSVVSLTDAPTKNPIAHSTLEPSNKPSGQPSMHPGLAPTSEPFGITIGTEAPSDMPSQSPITITYSSTSLKTAITTKITTLEQSSAPTALLSITTQAQTTASKTTSITTFDTISWNSTVESETTQSGSDVIISSTIVTPNSGNNSNDGSFEQVLWIILIILAGVLLMIIVVVGKRQRWFNTNICNKQAHEKNKGTKTSKMNDKNVKILKYTGNNLETTKDKDHEKYGNFVQKSALEIDEKKDGTFKVGIINVTYQDDHNKGKDKNDSDNNDDESEDDEDIEAMYQNEGEQRNKHTDDGNNTRQKRTTPGRKIHRVYTPSG